MYGDSGVKFKEPSSLNFVSVTMMILLVGICYGAWKYLPIYWQKLNIEEMMQSVTMKAHRETDETMRNTILLRVKEEFGFVEVQLTDVKVSRRDGWVEATVEYQVTVTHPAGKTHQFWLMAKADRKLLDL